MGRHRMQRFRRGQALVEFALVAPVLFLLLFSVIEFGRYIYTSNVLSDATREGTRYAIVHGSAAACKSGPLPGGPPPPVNACDPSGQKVVDVVKRFAVGVVADATIQVVVCWEDPANAGIGSTCINTNNGRGNQARVVVDYQFKSLVPLVPLPAVPIHAESALVIQH